MDTLLHDWTDQAPGGLLLQYVASNSVSRGIVFLLVATRIAGFLGIGPFLGRAIITWRARLGLVVLLTLIVAPGLPHSQHIHAPVVQVGHQEHAYVDQSLSANAASELPQPISEVAVLAACECSIGAALGLMVAIFLSGLKLAGEWLDRHSGLGLGGVLNPEYTSGGTAAAELTWLFCMVTMLVLQPVNGHLQVVRFVLDTFRAIPLGTACASTSFFELTKAMVQQSFILGLRVAMPFVVAMSLLDMTLGWARRSSRLDLGPLAFSIRVGAALLIMAATLPGICEAVSSSLLESFQAAELQLPSSIEETDNPPLSRS